MIQKGKVVGFVCKFCALLNFDPGPAPDAAIHIEVVELPCAGRIDSRAVPTAFSRAGLMPSEETTL